MCLKVCVSVAFCFASLLTFADGFFLPVFVRKQHPQTPALTNPQWATAYQSTSSVANPNASPSGAVNMNSVNPSPPVGQSGAYKDYNPYQQSAGLVTPLHQVPVSPLQGQYSYESVTASPYQIGAYPQFHSAFHSVQLVPCLCPISKDVIEQQAQQYQQSAPGNAPPSASLSESGSNEVHIKGGNQKVNS